MPQSPLRLIRQSAEFVSKDHVRRVPRKRRGLYVLYQRRFANGKERFDVVYVGMTTSGVHGRLEDHLKSKPDLWSHFSVYQVWDNVRDDEIGELEGLFRHIYRKDSRANALNVQKGFDRARAVCEDDLEKWA